MELSPSEIRAKTCANCLNSKLQTYADSTGAVYDVKPLCTINRKIVSDTDAELCSAFSPYHWAAVMAQNRKLL